MNFSTLKARVQGRLKLTSTESADRIGGYLNERYRAVATSIGMDAVRFGSISWNTVNATPTYTNTGMIHYFTLVLPSLNRVLIEKTQDTIRNLDPASLVTGSPEYWVSQKYNAATVTLRLWPTPDAVYGITADGIIAGTDMTANSDVPVLPEDFQDCLIFGACSDELMKLEKASLAADMEAKYTARVRELRYFIAKTAYLTLQQNERGNWWWGPWFHSYTGFY